MSKIAIKGNIAGTAVYSVSAPNTDTDRDLTLPDRSGEIVAFDGTDPAVLNRLATDGAIVELQKDGTTIGSIGASPNGGVYFAGASGTPHGIKPYSVGIAPIDDTGTLTNGSADIGASSARFKDLYLSGGVYLGGTGAANHLDDYEEGTWTPSVAGVTLTTAVGTYTKVGRQVTCNFQINSDATSSSSSFNLIGLPFTRNLSETGRSAGYLTYDPATTHATLLFQALTNIVQFRSVVSGVVQTITARSGVLMWGTIIYYV